MYREPFLEAIRNRLYGLPQGDIDKFIDYYSEMIDDRMEDGLTEEQAVIAMGSVDEIVEQILMDMSLPKLMKAKASHSRALRVWEIILLIIGSPVWAPILLALIVVVLSLCVAFLSIMVSMYAVDLSFLLAGIVSVGGGIVLVFTGQFVQALLALGTGLVLVGTAVLMFFAFNKVAFGMISLSKLTGKWIKSWFIRKGDVR